MQMNLRNMHYGFFLLLLLFVKQFQCTEVVVKKKKNLKLIKQNESGNTQMSRQNTLSLSLLITRQEI